MAMGSPSSTQRLSDSFKGKVRLQKSTVLGAAAALCFISFSLGASWSSSSRITSLIGVGLDDTALLSPPRSRRRVFTVFSTSCSPYQDWLSQALLYSHKVQNVEGELVRLMACGNSNYTLPKHSHDHYRVIRMPDFNARVWCDDYSPRNRPQSMSYWLNGRSDDADLPHDDDVVIQVDADQIFLSSHNDVSSVVAGVGIAAAYGLGQSWIQEWAKPFCDGKCDTLENDFNGSYGMPLILTAGDARRHADLWSDLTEEMRQRDSEAWMTEMYSCIIAARRLGIRISVIRMMLSAVGDEGEPWEQIQSWLNSPAGMGVWVAHYCQTYEIGSFRWSKYDNKETDIRSCNRSAINFPSPNKADLAKMKGARDGSLDLKNGTREAVELSRQVWMLDHTLEPVRRAIDAYYDEFCKQSTEIR